jgi:hypothetical protein
VSAAGVGEEQGGVEPVQQQAGDEPGAGVAVDAVVALELVLAAQDGVVGPPGPADEVGQRQQDGDEDADQHPEQGHAEEGGQPEDELGASDPPQAPDRGHVDQADGGGDDDRGQHRQGEVTQGAGGRPPAAGRW